MSCTISFKVVYNQRTIQFQSLPTTTTGAQLKQKIKEKDGTAPARLVVDDINYEIGDNEKIGLNLTDGDTIIGYSANNQLANRNSNQPAFNNNNNNNRAIVGIQVSEQLRIQTNNTSATIPDNNYARLMYYLKCMISVLPELFDADFPRELTDYNQYNSVLSMHLRKILLLFVGYLGPDEVLDKVVFIVPPELPQLEGRSNSFLNLSLESTIRAGFAKNNNAVLVQGKTYRATKIMVCTQDWLNRNYIQPVLELLTTKLTPSSSKWVNDSSSEICTFPKCNVRFGMFHRRHHCRVCGRLLCSTHCPPANPRKCIDCLF